MDDIPLGTLIAAFVVLLLVSAFFSIAETSMMALNRYRLRHLAKTGDRSATRVMALLERTERLLGTILLGNNLVNAAAAVLVGVIAGRLMGESELALLAATFVVTFFILVFSEITPKVMGATHPERFALPLSYPLGLVQRLLHPAVWFVNLFAQGLLRLLRFNTASAAAEHRLSLEELRTLVLEAGHFIPQKHMSMLLNIFELEAVTVDDVMVPRSQIEAVDISDPPEQVRNRIANCYHTRVPVYEGKPEEITGILHARRALGLLSEDELSVERIRSALAEPYFVPSGTPVLAQLQQFRDNRRRLALVVDEYGELLGLVTVEDIVEEIVGEFAGTAEGAAGGYVREKDGSVLVEGSALLRELNRRLGLKLPLEGSRTLNGLVLEHLQEIPEGETSVRIAGCQMEIVSTRGRVVQLVRILPQREAVEN